MGGLPAQVVRSEIRRTRDSPRSRSAEPPLPRGGSARRRCLDEASRRSCCSGGATPHLQVAHRAGVKVVPQVGSVEEGQGRGRCRSRRGDDPGRRSGRSRRGTAALQVLLPAVVDAVSPLPVVAAGGVANGRGVAAALMLGAQAVSMGTRFVQRRSGPGAWLQGRVVRARAEDTVHAAVRRRLAGRRPSGPARRGPRSVGGRRQAGERPAPGRGTIVGRYSVRAGDRRAEVRGRSADGRLRWGHRADGALLRPVVLARATSARPPTS